jgi:hypothetical protein
LINRFDFKYHHWEIPSAHFGALNYINFLCPGVSSPTLDSLVDRGTREPILNIAYETSKVLVGIIGLFVIQFGQRIEA